MVCFGTLLKPKLVSFSGLSNLFIIYVKGKLARFGFNERNNKYLTFDFPSKYASIVESFVIFTVLDANSFGPSKNSLFVEPIFRTPTLQYLSTLVL